MICILYKAVHCKQSSIVYYFYDCSKKSPILRSWGQHPYTWHHSPHPSTEKIWWWAVSNFSFDYHTGSLSSFSCHISTVVIHYWN